MPGLIFDFDGLVIDSERVMAEAVIAAVVEHGGALAIDDIGHLFGTTEADHLWEELLAERCEGRLTLSALEERLMATLPSQIDALPPLPGVVELLEAARAAGWRVGLGTGQEPDRLAQHLDRLGLRFDAVVTRSEVVHGKPAPDIFLEVARRLGVAPAECVVLEDSLPGAEAALAAGMRVVVCPSPVSAGLDFPAAVTRVASLLDVGLECL